MDGIYEISEVLVSFTKAWVCTIAICTKYLPESEFIKIPFSGGRIYSMRAPEKVEENDEVNVRHRQLYSWLSERACEKLKGDEEKCIVLWITDGNDNEEIMCEQIILCAYVIQCVKDDRFEQDGKLIRKRTQSTLKAVQVCSLTPLPDDFAVDLEVWKGPERLRYLEELVSKKQRVEHGSFRVGHWEIRCWMICCTETKQ